MAGIASADAGSTTKRPGSPRWIVIGVGFVILTVLTGALVAARADPTTDQSLCADVGAQGPPAESPRAALDAHFAEVERSLHITVDRSMWTEDGDNPHRTDTFVSYTSPVKAPDVHGIRLSTIGVERVADGTWSVTGGCV